MITYKKYQFKVYSFAGAFLGLLDPKRTGKPGFTTKINNGQGQFRFRFTTQFDDFDETLIAHMNLIRVFEVDNDNSLGRLLYTGFISEYAPFANNSAQGVEITLLGLVSFLNFAFYKDGSSFTVNNVGQTPGTIFKEIIDHFLTIYPMTSTAFPDGLIHYAGGFIDATGTGVTLNFTDKKWLQALNETFSYAPTGWFWRVAADGNVYLQPKPATPDHRFIIGKHVEALIIRRNNEKVQNKLQFRDSGAGVTNFNDSTSQTDFGVREAIHNGTETDDATSIDEFGDKFISDNKDPKIRARLIINLSFDIESINVGETCNVQNYNLDADIFDTNMQIASIAYTPERVTLLLEQDFSFGKEVVALTEQT